MPYFPVGETPVVTLDPLVLDFVSASGQDFSLSIRDNGASNAQAQALVTALAEMSNLGLWRWSFQDEQRSINKGAARVWNEAHDETVKLYIVFTNLDAASPDVTIRLPAPDAACIDANSGRLKEPADDARVLAMQTAALAYLEQVGFDYAYAGGYLSTIPAYERGITPVILDPAVDPEQQPAAPEA